MRSVNTYINHLYTRMTCQLGGHPMLFADFNVSTPSAVSRCRFLQGTCGIGIRASRAQALPLTSGILMSLAIVALLKGETRLALTFLFGFTCLLHTREIVSLTRRQFTFLEGCTQLHVELPGSKGAKRLGRPESVILKQPYSAVHSKSG